MKHIKQYYDDKIIIYINNRDEVDEVSQSINQRGYDTLSYHAGLSKEKRKEIQDKFINGDVKIIISTIAFGMGIDQIVKCVLIFGCPSSIEEYYQQIGRGGRDGENCNTVLYFDYSKFRGKEYYIKKENNNTQKLENLNNIKYYCFTPFCRRKHILEYFDEECDFMNCGFCDNCCEDELVDITNKIHDTIINSKNLNNDCIIIQQKYFNTTNFNIYNLLRKWKKYIIKNKFKTIPDNYKIKIPKKYLK